MSYRQDPRRRVAPGTGFSSSGRRTVLGYYAPLALTVSVAAIGIAAWIWSERSEDDDDERDQPGDDNRIPVSGPGGGSYPPDAYSDGFARAEGEILPGDHPDDAGVMARWQGALRRTPSPQQIFDGASKKVAAGVAAAGAFVGGALTSIREEDRRDFEDHSRWSEEVESRNQRRDQPAAPSMSGALPSRGVGSADRKKTVAIVISSESLPVDPEDITSDHVSILSHLPEHVTPETAKIFVMIYAPGLKHAPHQGNESRPTLSVASSYSNIAPEEAASADLAGGDLASPSSHHGDDSEETSPLFKTLYTQAQTLVEKESTIMAFSTPGGYVHLVRHISPEIVYVQESLTGKEGSAAQHISGWVRQVVVVVGDRGGLIDSEDESALADKGENWWEKEGMTGIGKRIDVVDVLRVGDDWRRRVAGFD